MPIPTDLRTIVAQLRGEGGCEWDRAQTSRSLVPFLLEEAWEVVEAVETSDDDELCRELGDLSFLVAMQAQLADERGAFDLADVERAAVDKMVARHPHVFGDADGNIAPTGDHDAWEARKRLERSDGASVLTGVPTAIPALLRAQKVGSKAAAVGFDWPTVAGVRDKVDEELAELDTAQNPAEQREELGDLLFTLVNLARHLDIDAEGALRDATRKFERRFREVEARSQAAGMHVSEQPASVLESLWQEVKRA